MSAIRIRDDSGPGAGQGAGIGQSGKRLLGSLLILVAGVWAWHFPVAAPALLAGLAAYLLLLFVRPAAWLVVVPGRAFRCSSLPTGRARSSTAPTTFSCSPPLGAGLWASRRHGAGAPRLAAVGRRAAAGLQRPGHRARFLVLEGLGTGLGPAEDMLAPGNALREAKGTLWAVALLPLLALEHGKAGDAGDGRVARLFSLGMIAGLLLAAVSILWERALFTGLFDFHHPYRVSGWFFGMRTGGAAIDAYLAAAAPFALAPLLLWRAALVRALAGPLVLLLLLLPLCHLLPGQLSGAPGDGLRPGPGLCAALAGARELALGRRCRGPGSRAPGPRAAPDAGTDDRHAL